MITTVGYSGIMRDVKIHHDSTVTWTPMQDL